MANRLSRMLDGAKITIIDRKEEHNYQPGHTLVATSVWPVEKVRDRNADFQPAGVEWVKDMEAGFDPAGNTVITAGDQRIPHDFVVVPMATGSSLQELAYWVDWANLASIVLGIGVAALALAWPAGVLWRGYIIKA